MGILSNVRVSGLPRRLRFARFPSPFSETNPSPSAVEDVVEAAKASEHCFPARGFDEPYLEFKFTVAP